MQCQEAGQKRWTSWQIRLDLFLECGNFANLLLTRSILRSHLPASWLLPTNQALPLGGHQTESQSRLDTIRAKHVFGWIDRYLLQSETFDEYLTNIDTFFTINCFDWDKDGAHDLIGSLSTTLREFTFGPVQLPLVDPAMVGRYFCYFFFFLYSLFSSFFFLFYRFPFVNNS